jgi:hypothetical protein
VEREEKGGERCMILYKVYYGQRDNIESHRSSNPIHSAAPFSSILLQLQ